MEKKIGRKAILWIRRKWYRCFKWQTKVIADGINWTGQRRGNLMRGTELILKQNLIIPRIIASVGLCDDGNEFFNKQGEKNLSTSESWWRS